MKVGRGMGRCYMVDDEGEDEDRTAVAVMYVWLTILTRLRMWLVGSWCGVGVDNWEEPCAPAPGW
jgi:hypothetical protein